ncbi:MAG TPA: right-handed parallel beta-helix repeat-containing protein [Candidatus Saccharimonadia bacterium]|nr:right-handed parallel beta-helix repeat-containing protein [Candidatus Saccharimonadia bacterium]
MGAVLLQAAPKPVGTQGHVGCLENPKRVERLEITEPGVYENYLVDSNGAGGNRVKITADNVTLRNCEIRNASGNGIGVFGKQVVIENCRIHHLLAGSFTDQKDAHGITGRWGHLVIRNCDISYVSGDCIQFDPDRKQSGTVMIEDCNLWTGPLPDTAGGFAKGERPGENAVDTKTPPDGERCKLVIRNCHLHGWNQPAAIQNAAAVNLKENVDAEVIHCVASDNEIAFRVRGPGDRGGAHVKLIDCAIYDSGTGIRIEDAIEQLEIRGLMMGEGVREKVRFAGAKPTASATYGKETLPAPALKELLQRGFTTE